MQDKTVSIGEVKRDISELVNCVAYGHERIVLTSRGKPKAVLVSVEDYARLQKEEEVHGAEFWAEWLRQANELSQRIAEERNGQPLNIDAVIQADKEDRDQRHDYLFQS
jgi:prevent-host-death family protein